MSCRESSYSATVYVMTESDEHRPNHEELLAFYSIPCPSSPDETLPSLVEPLIDHLLYTVGIGNEGSGVVVIRCGGMGSCVGTRKGGIQWFPAYFQPEDQDRVVDVSGGESQFPLYAPDAILIFQLAMHTSEDMQQVYTSQTGIHTMVSPPSQDRT